MKNWITKNIRFIFCLYFSICLCFLGGCSFFGKKTDLTPLPPSEEVRRQQEKSLKEAEVELDKKNHRVSIEKFDDFIQKYPQSIFLVQAHLGLAQNRMALSEWQKAIDSFRTILHLTMERQPQLAAESLYSSAYCYEMLGEDLKLFTSLKDSEKLKKHLPDEIRLAELPARLASAYYKNGDTVLADQYFQEADRGMAQLKAQKGAALSKIWISKTYFKMGGLISSQLSPDNLKSHLESLGKMQLFTLKAVEEAGEPWSERAAGNLRRNYMDVWTVIMSWPKDPNLDPVAAYKNQVEMQGQLLIELLNTIEKFRTSLAPENSETPNSVAKSVNSLLSFLNEMEIKARAFIMDSSATSELTPETKERQKEETDEN